MIPGMDSSYTHLMVAWRLMVRTEQLLARRTDSKVQIPSLKEAMERERDFFSTRGKRAGAPVRRPRETDDVRIKLSNLIRKLKEINKNPGKAKKVAVSEQTVIAVERREIEVTFDYKALSPVNGLVVRSKSLAETDRYAFEFKSGAAFKIIDKWSGKSTTIWGDPHVDTSDEEGRFNGEFSDLKSSNSHTTLVLEDGTEVVFTASDKGIIEEVDIFKGTQHLNGIGGGSIKWAQESQWFAAEVLNDASSAKSSLPQGDVVYAGGDGNDWYDSLGRLVWGKTTGPSVTSRPYASMQMTVRQTFEQALLVHTVERQV